MFSTLLFVVSRLCRAATNGDLEGIKHLADKNNVNTKGWLGWAPLHKAAQQGHAEIVKYLLSENLNATVDIRDLENHTPLHLAAGTNQETPGHIEVVSYLISKGADVNAVDDGQYSPFHLAVLNSNYSIAQLLLEANCNVNHRNLDQFTALHSACSQKNVKFIQLLLNYGADANLKDARGKTPIDLAKRAGINLNIRSPTDPDNLKKEKESKSNSDDQATVATDLANEIQKELQE